MTAEEFEERYAARSGISVAELRAMGRIVVRCDCGDDLCEGWASVHRELGELGDIGENINVPGELDERLVTAILSSPLPRRPPWHTGRFWLAVIAAVASIATLIISTITWVGIN